MSNESRKKSTSKSSSTDVKVKKINLDEVEKKKTSSSKKKTTAKKQTSTTKKSTSGKHASKDTGKKVVKKDIKEAKHVKQDNKKKNIIIVIFLIVCLCGVVYSGYKIYKWYTNLEENENIVEDLSDKIKEDENGIYHIDFDALKNINSDTVAYIDYKQFNINYVVVKGKDNAYYLDHNFSKKYNDAGWIFADYRNKFDGTDKNIVMYGHSMRNGSMFGSLHKLLNDKNYEKEENQTITFATPDGTYKYKLFSVYTIEAEDYYITTDFKKNKDWKEFINKMKSRSIYKFNVDVNEDDTIITLSTCQGSTGYKRMVVQAVRVKE